MKFFWRYAKCTFKLAPKSEVLLKCHILGGSKFKNPNTTTNFYNSLIYNQ